MLLNNILTFIAGAIMASSKPAGHYSLLILGRFLIGVNCGKMKLAFVFLPFHSLILAFCLG